MREWAPSKPDTQRNRKGVVLSCAIAAVIAAVLTISPSPFTASSLSFTDGSSSRSPAVASDQKAPSPVGFAAIVANVTPAVVDIRARAVDDESTSATRRGPHDGMLQAHKPRFSTSQGSGFFITADGYAVTNNHVISGSAVAEVTTDRGEIYQARIVGTDPISDLAVLKVDGRTDFPHVQFADAPPSIGDWIVAVGNPFGLGGTVTAGIVSARGRDLADAYEDLLQIDAPVNRGNSGGPSFDLDGKVVGVNTLIISPTGGSVGIAFAIPAATARRVVAQLMNKGSVTRGWLGIQFQSVSPEIANSLGLAKSSGILVADVRSASPAAEAGLAAGDLVRSMNGKAVGNAHDFSRMLDDAAPGSKVMLGLVRNGREISVAAKVGDVPAAIEAQRTPAAVNSGNPDSDRQLGLMLTPAETPAGGHGVAVVGIDPGGLAAGRGISLGDVILDVASQEVAAPTDVYAIVAGAQKAGKRSILLRVKSGDAARFIVIVLPTG
jgi:serine protease Do